MLELLHVILVHLEMDFRCSELSFGTIVKNRILIGPQRQKLYSRVLKSPDLLPS